MVAEVLILGLGFGLISASLISGLSTDDPQTRLEEHRLVFWHKAHQSPRQEALSCARRAQEQQVFTTSTTCMLHLQMR